MPEKRVLTRVAGVAIVLAVAVLTLRCESQEQAQEAEEPATTAAEATTAEAGPARTLRAESFGKVVTIVLVREERRIIVQPEYVVLCVGSDAEPCPPASDSQFEWQIRAGGLNEGETLFIRGVRDNCFSWDVLPIPYPDNVAESGPVNPDCLPDKHGFFWPYMVTLRLGDDVIAETDPGGIFRRGGG